MSLITRLAKLLMLSAALCAASDASEMTQKILREHMSTKTLYAPPMRSNPDSVDDTCTPVQLNFVIRHGTRNPTIKDITRINNTHSRILTARNKSVPSWVESWKNPYPKETEAWLADPGIRELIEIGHRLRARLSPLAVYYNASKFVFDHTWKIRTKQSAQAFAFGFFDGVQPVYYHSSPIGKDEVLRFYDNCPAFQTLIDTNKSSTIEHSKYRDSEQMQKNLIKFQKVANFADATQKDMEAAYAGCAFDVAVQDVYDHWCSFFDDEMLLSMDYFQDLKHFYRKSHGHALSYEIATPLLQDIFRSMKKRVLANSGIEGYFRFAHAETILPLASLLNVSYFDRHTSDREGHFRADTPLNLALQRKFKSSTLAPFAANIGFVLYECANHDEEAKDTAFKVKTLLNEREVLFNECEGQALCPFDVLETIFYRWLYEFNFQEQCILV
ncbi:RxLR-like protein [Plasmopara halstedii]|uniref:Multiple inositol polyphosphate phosphatase 1 n=1 Tax=Plasmopara halstedii TaxID=4781 RepID=A0A0P1AL50_PLAHL|nr:RxLR-like protein [Plasmopara halstedii]CEG41608.1 RxLR-like protein [Plasmopara halstedii]|eukprot:XP_024577977.1 RxLR-like protein [Plasmopara halstedii]